MNSHTRSFIYVFSRFVCETCSFLIPNPKIKKKKRRGGFGCGPERDHVAQLGGQAAELVGRQVQVDQVGQFGDVWWETGQVVVVDVQRREVGERP